MQPGRPSTARSAGTSFADLRGKMKLWSVSNWLIAICVVCFVLQNLFAFVTTWGAFTISGGVFRGQIWRGITYQFLHGSPTHLIFNMIGLWVFGQMAERRMGRAKFLTYYLICGIGGAIGYALLALTPLVASSGSATLVGASAGLFGCIAAAMTLMPDRILQLVLPPIDITVFRFGAVYLALAAFIVLFHGNTSGSNAGGEAAHLGGAAIGFLLARRLHLLNWADRLDPRSRRSTGSSDTKNPSYMKYHGWR
jgi:membrane associated rhomboid family serine protease